MAQSFSVKAILEAVDQSFSSTIDRAGQSVQKFGNATQDRLAGVGKAMTVAGAATTVMGVQAIKNFGSFQQALNQAAVIAGGTSKDIDGLADVANRMGAELPISAQDAANAMVAMARDGASIGTIKKEFPAIAQAATAAGADLQTTASVVQQSMNIWGKSLKSPQQAAGILVQVANQSNASIESMQQALADVGPTASAAGYSMQDTANAIGLLTNTGMSAAQAAENLNHAIVLMQSPTKQSKAYMDQLGISFRDAQGNMKSLPQIAGELNTAFDKASKSTQGFGKAQQDAALKAMFGQDGMRVMRTLMKSVADETDNTTTSWNASSKAIEKFAGTTATATKNLSSQANEMQQNLGSKIEQLGGNWEALSNKAMAAKGGFNSSLLDMMNSTLEWASSSDSSIAKVTRGFIGLSPVIGPATTALGGFITNAGKIMGVTGGIVSGLGNAGKVIRVFAMAGGDISKVTQALTVLSKESKIAKIALNGLKAGSSVFSFLVTATSKAGQAFSALTSIMMANPFIAIAAVIAVVVAALVLFFTKTKLGQQLWQSFTQFLSSAWQGLVSIAQSVWSAIASAFTTVVGVIKGVWSGITSFFSGLWQGIVSIATTVWNSFVTSISPIVEAFKTLWSSLTEFFSTLWQGIVTVAQTIWSGLSAFFSALWQGIVAVATPIWNVLVTVITTVWNTIKMVVQTAMTIISTVIQTVMTVIQTIWSAIWNVIVTVAQTIWNVIKTVIQTAINVVSTIIQTTLTVIQTIWSTTWNIIVTVAQTIWNTIVTVISTAINVIAGIIRAITQAIQGNWSAVWNTIKGIAQTVWNAIRSVVTSVINAIKSVITSVMNAIRSVMTSIWNGIKSVTSSVWSGIRSVVTSVINGIRSTVSSIMNSIKSVFSSGWNTVKSVTSSGIHGAANVVRSVAGGMVSAGSNFVMGFVRGITGAIGSAVQAAANMARQALNAAKAALGIHSPSRVMRDQVGYYVTEGMAVGILGNIKSVSHAMDRVADASIISIPKPDTSQFMNTMASLSNLHRQMATGYATSMTGELNLSSQPAYINLNLGGSDYSTFVDDISRKQGVDAEFKRKYRF
ncbi:phage tail tape measure protein [Ligilactobacillus salivarius]|uniref:phage tail tape measure protein n=1 Tax=Ligilactobacillus salivarius TaxID=1624 RepID=UPI0021508629|nr:phage tail tape measure protein [Ligilactobacillus salivarius]MDH4959853.1 phage tail tape measure protein [Ligilactobacillus salivarius]UUY24061.1 phage tail tape measure protein [Ligilactobacillus salivarius]